MENKTEKKSGGARPGAGRKPAEKTKTKYSVYLTAEHAAEIIKKHKSLSKALETLL